MSATPAILFVMAVTLGAAAAQRKTLGPIPQRPAFDVQVKLSKRAPNLGRALAGPDASAYILGLGNRLAEKAGMPQLAAVQITDCAETRASLSPDGALQITIGALRRTQTEAELAGVLAHLIAHIGRLRRTKPTGNGPPLSRDVLSVCVLAGHPLPAGWRSTLQRVEQESNHRAVQYLEAAGYDPLEMLTFFSKLQYEEPRLSEAFSADDLLALRSQLEQKPAPGSGYVLTTSTFDGIHRRLVTASR